MTSYIDSKELESEDKDDMPATNSGTFKAPCIWVLDVLKMCDYLCLWTFGRHSSSDQSFVVEGEAAPNKYRI